MSTPSLIDQLRALSSHEHGDTSLGADAADEIERLRGLCSTAVGYLRDFGGDDEAEEVESLIVDMES